MAAREYLEEVNALRVTLSAIEQVLNLPKLEADFKTLEAEASAPNLWDDPEKAQVVTSKLSRVQATLNKSNTIDFNFLTKGIYIIVLSNNSEIFVQQKLIKE